jgi:hypothetical protein
MTALVSPGVGSGSGSDPQPEPESVGPEPVESGRRRRSPLMNILLIVPVLVAAAGVYMIITHKFAPAQPKTTYQVPAVFNLRQGDCFDQEQNGGAVSLLPCSVPHDAEVFATFGLPGTAWPGVDAVQSQADSGCAGRLDAYLGSSVMPSSLSRNATYPNEVTWQAGVRTVVCTISAADGSKTTGSFRGTGLVSPAASTPGAPAASTGPTAPTGSADASIPASLAPSPGVSLLVTPAPSAGSP